MANNRGKEGSPDHAEKGLRSEEKQKVRNKQAGKKNGKTVDKKNTRHSVDKKDTPHSVDRIEDQLLKAKIKRVASERARQYNAGEGESKPGPKERHDKSSQNNKVRRREIERIDDKELDDQLDRIRERLLIPETNVEGAGDEMALQSFEAEVRRRDSLPLILRGVGSPDLSRLSPHDLGKEVDKVAGLISADGHGRDDKLLKSYYRDLFGEIDKRQDAHFSDIESGLLREIDSVAPYFDGYSKHELLKDYVAVPKETLRWIDTTLQDAADLRVAAHDAIGTEKASLLEAICSRYEAISQAIGVVHLWVGFLQVANQAIDLHSALDAKAVLDGFQDDMRPALSHVEAFEGKYAVDAIQKARDYLPNWINALNDSAVLSSKIITALDLATIFLSLTSGGGGGGTTGGGMRLLESVNAGGVVARSVILVDQVQHIRELVKLGAMTAPWLLYGASHLDRPPIVDKPMLREGMDGSGSKSPSKSVDRLSKSADLEQSANTPEEFEKLMSKTRSPDDNADTYVYRLLDDQDNIIYIGSSNWARRRLIEHLRDSIKGWQIARMEVAKTANPMRLPQALRLEEDLIQDALQRGKNLLNLDEQPFEKWAGKKLWTPDLEFEIELTRIKRWAKISL